MKKINKKISALLLIAVFVFAPISPLNYIARSQVMDEYGYEHIVDYQEWATDKIITTPIIIDEGGTLAIKKGVTVTFNGGALEVNGSLFTKGTLKENVVFRKADGSSNYSINVGGKMVMRNTDVSGGGTEAYIIGKNSLLNTAEAFFIGGINVGGGLLDAEGCNFHDNEVAIYIGGGSVKVNRSKFVNNSILDVGYGENDGVDFKYNWWGSAGGPARTCYGSSCYYEKIDGDIDFSNWLAQPEFRDPVIIIPGILGSWEKDGQLQIDPIFHTYDNLYSEFANNGYTAEKDLFVFPYEWRDSNIENAKKLKTKIAEIKLAQNWPKVDIVAHSMGGLLAREYIESDNYGNDVDQLISLATPNLGAPEAYVKWDGADWFFSPVDMYMKHIINQEAKEGGFSDTFDYIHNRPITSLQELLPVYSYLYEADNGNNLRTYPNNYPRNEFLEILNNNSDKLNLVGYDKIIGDTGENNTISGIDVVNVDMGKYWMHGYPLGFEIIIGDRGMRYSVGDITVPLDSAKSENVKSDNFIELTSDHQGIVTDAQKDVLELLTNVRPAAEIRHSLIRDILIAQAFSPIDIQVISPSGKWVGKNINGLADNMQIEGAYYTGFGTENEFVTIPNPEDGDYKIITQGTGDGNYKVETTKISEDANNPQNATESTGTISGIAEPDKVEEKTITVAGDSVIAEPSTADTEAPIINITVPEENKTYLNNETLNINYSVIDNISAPEKIKREVFLDGVVSESLQIDLALEKLGGHKFKITAEDEAGNKGEKEISFTNSADINSIIANVNHYSKLGLLKDKKTKNTLLKKAKEIKFLMSQLEKINENNWFFRRFVANWKRNINHKIDKLIGKINGKKGNYDDDEDDDRPDYKNNFLVSQPARDLLIESLESIKYL